MKRTRVPLHLVKAAAAIWGGGSHGGLCRRSDSA